MRRFQLTKKGNLQKKFKIRRRQLRLNRFQSTVRNENREGVSYEHNIGLNLVTEVCTQNINYKILQKVNKHLQNWTEGIRTTNLFFCSQASTQGNTLWSSKNLQICSIWYWNKFNDKKNRIAPTLGDYRRRKTLILRIHSSWTLHNNYRNCCSQHQSEIFWGPKSVMQFWKPCPSQAFTNLPSFVHAIFRCLFFEFHRLLNPFRS